MTTHQAGEIVGSGMYVSLKDWDLQIVHSDGERLDAEGRHPYHRIPLLMMVLLSPAIGGVYAAAFPLVVFLGFARVVRDHHVKHYRLFSAGEVVRWGIYVGVNRLCVSYVSAENVPLEGEAGARFVRVPTWMVVVGSPVIGGLYVVLFPFLLGAALLTVLLAFVTAPFRGNNGRAS